MKRAFALLLMLACALPLRATAQRPDEIRIAGTAYELVSPPDIPMLRDHPERMPKAMTMMTSLWRGYVATWAIRDNRLFLDNVRIPTDKNFEYKAPESKRWQPVMEDLFGNAAPRVADWYTGNLVIPTGEMVKYVHMGFASTYSSYVVATVVKGEVRQQRDMNAKEFDAFRRTQFAAWKKTPEYAKALEELNEPDVAKAEEFLFLYASGQYVARVTP
ncbi:MAG TPA: hypothetical protein VM733_09255 [Thermoanaerobaculia bacterium]|nr:hypothetical protein [Thermoanaerobaculia bacterium]